MRYQKLSPRLNHACITQESYQRAVQALHLFQDSAVHLLLYVRACYGMEWKTIFPHSIQQNFFHSISIRIHTRNFLFHTKFIFNIPFHSSILMFNIVVNTLSANQGCELDRMSSSSIHFSKSEFKFEFSNLLFTSSSSIKISFFEFKFEFRQMNIQSRDNFFTAGAHAIKKIKIFRSCSRFKTIPQLFSAIEIVCVVVTIEQQTIFRNDLLLFFFQQFRYVSNELEKLYSSSSSSSEKIYFRVQVFFIYLFYLVAYLSSNHEKAINALYELA